MLEVAGLSKRFGGFPAVTQVSFNLRQGEILGLIGPNGSGKSTTFNLIAGAMRPSAGSIRFEGKDIGGLPAHKVCRMGLARTFQIPRPFRRLSLVENVMLAAHYGQSGRITKGEARRRAEAALETVGLQGASGGTEGLGAASLKKLELARALATAATASARRREPRRPRSCRDGARRLDARDDPQPARDHDHLGRAHHGRC